MDAILDVLESLSDKKYKVFIQDNKPIFCDDIEIKKEVVYCSNFDCEDVLMIPLMRVEAIKERRIKPWLKVNAFLI